MNAHTEIFSSIISINTKWVVKMKLKLQNSTGTIEENKLQTPSMIKQ